MDKKNKVKSKTARISHKQHRKVQSHVSGNKMFYLGIAIILVSGLAVSDPVTILSQGIDMGGDYISDLGMPATGYENADFAITSSHVYQNFNTSEEIEAMLDDGTGGGGGGLPTFEVPVGQPPEEPNIGDGKPIAE